MDDIEYQGLLNQLGDKGGKCILVLGPEFINIDSTETDFTECIQDYLSQKKFSKFTKGCYFSEDGFLYYDTPAKNTIMLGELKKFYETLPLTKSYENLARIPFSAIISLSPDDLLVKAYKKINRKNIFNRYRSGRFEDGPSETSSDEPMIYNLMGHYEDIKTLFFTFNNLFDFLYLIFQESALKNFKKHIIQAEGFLFLGFNFDKWYLKLIFYLLNKFRTGSTQEEVSRNAIFNYKIKDKEQIFDSKIQYYRASFKLNFSPENEKEFIDKLFNDCSDLGILSEVKTAIPDAQVNDVISDQYKILFLGSSPEGAITLKLWEEYNSIKNSLPDAKKKYFNVIDPPNYDTQISHLMTWVNDFRPQLLYLSMHGSDGNKLVFSGKKDDADYLELSRLCDKIKKLSNKHKNLQCIIFSCCESEEQAKSISEIVPYCIGMNEAVDPKACKFFAEGFFMQLYNDSADVEYAFEMGLEKMKDNDLTEEIKIPVLYHIGNRVKTSNREPG